MRYPLAGSATNGNHSPEGDGGRRHAGVEASRERGHNLAGVRAPVLTRLCSFRRLRVLFSDVASPQFLSTALHDPSDNQNPVANHNWKERPSETRLKSFSSKCAPPFTADREAALREERRRINRRDYNRQYMRKWRTDPHHHVRERQNRLRCDLQRKARASPLTEPLEGPRCAFCKQRQRVCMVERLKPLPGGFAIIRLPYCGEC
jgi:hypothetical protein